MIKFELAIKPQAWQRTAIWKGRTLTPLKTRAFERAVGEAALKYAPSILLDMPLKLTVMFFLPRPKKPKWSVPAGRPDLDNLLKAMKDALNGIIWTDDARVHQYGEGTGKYWDEVGGMGRIRVSVEEV